MMKCVFKLFLVKIQNWYYHSIHSETKEVWMDEWRKEQELRSIEEAEEAECLAYYLRQREEDKLMQQQEDEYRRQWEEEDIKFQKEFEDREELKQQQFDEDERYKFFCPHCDTRWSYPGKCKTCDRAFGHD